MTGCSGGGEIEVDAGEVDFGAGDVVEVVGEDVESDVGDDLGDLAVGVSGGAYLGYGGVGDQTAFDDEGLGELESGGGFGVSGFGVAGGLDGVGLEADHLADGGVGGEAVLAGVGLADGQGDLFAEARFEGAGGGSGGEAEVGVEDGRGLGHGLHHVGGDAEFGLDGVEELFGLASCV